MTETDALKESAKIMYITLNGVYQLHDITKLEPEDSDKAIDACAHCSEIAEAIVHYPCPTVQVLLSQMVEEELTSDEASPAE